MRFLEKFLQTRNGNKIQVLIGGEDSSESLPIVYIPGMAGTALDAKEIFPYLQGDFHISLSMRGRGKSDAPSNGYSVLDHARDIADIIAGLGIEKYVLHTYSLSTLYALSAFNLEEFIKPKGFIIGDFPAHGGSLPLGWVESFSQLRVNGVPVLNNISREVLFSIQRESVQETFEPNLKLIDCPVLLLIGGKESMPPSMLSSSDVQLYLENTADIRTHQFVNSGHFFRDSHREEYCGIINNFVRDFC